MWLSCQAATWLTMDRGTRVLGGCCWHWANPAGRKRATFGVVKVRAKEPGFNGTGYARPAARNSGIIRDGVDGNTGGSATLQIRYSLESRKNRSAQLSVNDTLTRGIGLETPLIATGGFRFYAPVIGWLFASACVYGSVIKRWRKDRITRVERRPSIGTARRLVMALERSEDSVNLNAAFIERLNLTLRRTVSYLVRCTPGHAPRTTPIALQPGHVNLCRLSVNSQVYLFFAGGSARGHAPHGYTA